MSRFWLKIVIVFSSISLCSNRASAQYVAIPDQNFLTFLANYIPTANQCFMFGTMDTTCTDILNLKYMDCSRQSIQDLTGIQYFKSLEYLNCSHNLQLDSLPELPPKLRELNCGSCHLSNIPRLPDSLRSLTCVANNFVKPYFYLPWPPYLRFLDCTYSDIDTMPALPSILDTLICNSMSLLRDLPLMPDSLIYFECQDDSLSQIPYARNLRHLDCSNNHCLLNNLSSSLSDSLRVLYCYFSHVQGKLVIPAALKILYCENNAIDTLILPPSGSQLVELRCPFNRIKAIENSFSDSLVSLGFGENLLPSVPSFPANLSYIDCGKNLLTYLPPLPDSLSVLYCDSNIYLHCFPPIHNVGYLYFQGTPIDCISSYGNVTTSVPPLSSVPTCTSGNTYGCVYLDEENIHPIQPKVFPNPASDFCTVELNTTSIPAVANFTNATGQVVYRQNINQSSTQISISNLPSGFYLVSVTNNDGFSGVVKFVKE